MSAMKEAMLGKGFVDPKKRLREIGIEAWESSGGQWDGARDVLFKGIRGDAALLWELFTEYRSKAADDLMTDIAAEMRNKMKPLRAIGAVSSASGHTDRVNQHNPARRAADSSSGGAGQWTAADQSAAARPIWDKSWQNPQKAMAAVAAVARLSLLDTFKINGRSVGDLTAAEAIGWASSRKRDVQFVHLLTAGLPLDKPIRKYRTGDEAAALYDTASREVRDAK